MLEEYKIPLSGIILNSKSANVRSCFENYGAVYVSERSELFEVCFQDKKGLYRWFTMEQAGPTFDIFCCILNELENNPSGKSLKKCLLCFTEDSANHDIKDVYLSFPPSHPERKIEKPRLSVKEIEGLPNYGIY